MNLIFYANYIMSGIFSCKLFRPQVTKVAFKSKKIKTFFNNAWKYGFIFIKESYDLFTILI